MFLIVLPFVWIFGTQTKDEYKNQFSKVGVSNRSITPANYSKKILRQVSTKEGTLAKDKIPDLYLALSGMQSKNWKQIALPPQSNVEKIECKNLLFMGNADKSIALYAFAWNKTTSTKELSVALRLLNHPSYSKLNKTIGVLLYAHSDKCLNANIISSLPFLKKISSVVIFGADPALQGFQVSQSNTRFSSILWQEIFPSLNEKPLRSIYAQSAFGFARNRQPHASDIPAIVYNPPSGQPEKKLASTLFQAVGKIDAIKDGGLMTSGFWIGINRALSTTSQWIVIILLLVLIFLPVINRIILDNARLNLFGSLFLAIYFSIPIFIFWAFLKIMSSLIDPQAAMLTAVIIMAASLPLLKHFEKSLFMIENTTGSALLLLSILLAFLSFSNAVFFIAALPFIFLGSHLRSLPKILSLLFFFLCAFPLAYLFFQTKIVLVEPQGPLNPDTILSIFSMNIFNTLYMILIGGAIIALIHKPDNPRLGL